MKVKSKITTGLLLGMIVFLIGGIFFITYLLTNSNENENQPTSNVAPKKTKAANITYSKLIASNPPTPIPELGTKIPGGEITPTTGISPTLTLMAMQPSPTVENLTPTPTEILLAKNNLTGTPSATVVETKILAQKELPDAGFIQNAIIMFSVSAVLVFFAFLF